MHFEAVCLLRSETLESCRSPIHFVTWCCCWVRSATSVMPAIACWRSARRSGSCGPAGSSSAQQSIGRPFWSTRSGRVRLSTLGSVQCSRGSRSSATMTRDRIRGHILPPAMHDSGVPYRTLTARRNFHTVWYGRDFKESFHQCRALAVRGGRGCRAFNDIGSLGSAGVERRTATNGHWLPSLQSSVELRTNERYRNHVHLNRWAVEVERCSHGLSSNVVRFGSLYRSRTLLMHALVLPEYRPIFYI